MSDLVANVLKSIGPCVSTDLVAALVKDCGLTPVNARQKVSRSTSIKKLAHLPFPRNSRFVYLQAEYASPEFWSALTRALLEHTMSYGGGLAALIARGGVMPLAHFTIACGAPLAQKRHLSPTSILERLKAANLIQTFDVPGIGECVELSHTTPASSFDIAEMRARMRTEEVLLCAVRDWARSLGLVSYNTVALRDEGTEQPRVGTFNWDLTAPSYLGALTQWDGGKVKPGFLVCDVLLGVNVSVQGLQPFINKCKTIRTLTKVGRCFQVFVADGYSKEAYALAKSEGVVPATTATLFGNDVAKALRELTDVLSESFPRDKTLEKVDAVFKRLSHIEGAANNLRGALFEYLVAEAVRLGSAHSDIQLNELLRDADGRTAEVDVLVVHRDQSIRFIECKGYKPGGTVPDDMVERWLNDRVPLIRKIAGADPHWRKCRLEFEFWTTGRLTPAAAAAVHAEAEKTKKFGLSLVDRDELERRVAATNNAALKRTLNEHFIGHPLEKAEREARRPRRQLPIPRGPRLRTREGVDRVFLDSDEFEAGDAALLVESVLGDGGETEPVPSASASK